MAQIAFQPRMSSTPNQVDVQQKSVTGTSARTALTNAPQLRVENQGVANLYINFGGGNVVAQATDIRIQPGQVEVFTKPDGAEYIAYIGDAATTLHLTAGDGP